MTGFGKDLRLALRRVRRRPAFAAVAVLTLALGIGGVTAIFSLVNGLHLRPLPFEDPDRLYRVWDVVESGRRWNNSERSFHALRASNGLFQGVAGYEFRWFNLSGDERVRRVRGVGATVGWLEILGVRPVVGRGFTPDEERAGDDARVVLVGHGLWQRAFGGESELVGRTVRLNGEAYEIVGVMPEGINFPFGAELWVPTRFGTSGTRHFMYTTGRLRPGLTREQLRGGLAALSERMAREHPDSHRGWHFEATTVRRDVVTVEGFRPEIPRQATLLLVGVGLLLLIGCSNVATLFVARAVDRRRETAVRAALGAGRWRLLRRSLTESSALVIPGAILGVVLAWRVKDHLGFLNLPRNAGLSAFLSDVPLDLRVLALTAAVAGGTALFVSLLSTWKSVGPDLRGELVQGGGGRVGGRRRGLLGGLASLEIALAFVLLTGTGLLLSDFAEQLNRDMGFSRRGLLTGRLYLPEFRYAEPGEREVFRRQVERRLEALPGTADVGFASALPVEAVNRTFTDRFRIEGAELPEPDAWPIANTRSVTPDYFATMGIPILRGRTFAREARSSEVAGDTADGLNAGSEPRPVLVSRSMARRHWPDENPVGMRIAEGVGDAGSPEWHRVIGVVGDVADFGGLRSTVYFPLSGGSVRDLTLVVRSSEGRSTSAALAPEVRRTIRQVDPDLPTGDLLSMEELVDRSLAQQRATTALLGVFAGFGLFLSVIGIFGVLACGLRRRRRELAVRAALGAGPWRVASLVARRGAWLAAVGLGIGLVGALGVSRLMSGALSGLDLLRWEVYAAAAGVVAGAALLAAWLPARRASRMDPMTILRAE